MVRTREIPRPAGGSAGLRNDAERCGFQISHYPGRLGYRREASQCYFVGLRWREVAPSSGCNSDVADAADEIVTGFPSLLHGQDFDRIGLVVRSKDQLTADGFHVFDGAGSVFEDSIHVVLAPAVRLERVVVAIDQERGAGKKTGIHAHAFAGVGFDEDEAFPAGTVAFDFGLELLQKALLEFKDLFHVHAGEQGVRGGDGAIGEDDALKFVIARRNDGGTFVDLGGIEQIEHRETLDRQDAIHAFEAEATFAVQEVGNVSLLEAGLPRQAKPGEIAIFDAFPQSIAKVFLQDTEFHGREYSMVYSPALIRAGFPQL